MAGLPQCIAQMQATLLTASGTARTYMPNVLHCRKESDFSVSRYLKLQASTKVALWEHVQGIEGGWGKKVIRHFDEDRIRGE